ncbi:sodium-dependent bicarbonate transport family permease [Ectothiorhodospiraceae bacterium 2226]|nr:sodium-dependent bicarbonate transport family permease [Ectothiorhodospiraceae bacterium 2226]
MFDLSNLMIPAILFFGLGFLARIIKSDLRFPPDLAKALSIYLLIAIGLHGGVELAEATLGSALSAVGAALALGFGLPLLAYAILVMLGRIDRLNASAIAAHYGSVSAGTFLTAIAFLQSLGVPYESYPVIMLAIMESPAIIVGLVLAKLSRRVEPGAEAAGNGETRELLREALTNGSVLLLLGGMFIGYAAQPEALASIKPFYTEIFMGALSLFLLEMGMEAARRIGAFRKVGLFLTGFGIVMPLIGGAVGLALGHWVLGFSVGGTTLVAVLGASASYIAVPPAMRLAIPEANPSYYLTLALGITFPFNVLFGIPLYYYLARLLGA